MFVLVLHMMLRDQKKSKNGARSAEKQKLNIQILDTQNFVTYSLHNIFLCIIIGKIEHFVK